MSVVVIIPARLGSTRLPGKALAEIAGEPMIVHVWRRAGAARGVDRVLVATDDAGIARVVEEAGGTAVMTRTEHASGTDRLAEVARSLGDEIVVNVQGDLPFLDPGYVEAAVAPLRLASESEAGLRMATLATPLRAGEAERPQVVKVVRDLRGDALYFSRSPIPSAGDGLRHIGLYAYRRDLLIELATLAPTPLERSERLEQLRALEHGHRIRVEVVAAGEGMIEVDTPEDLERARAAMAAEKEERRSHG